MCYFVFVAVSHHGHPEVVARFTALGFDVVPTSNSEIRSSFNEHDAISVVSHQGCSCDIYAAKPFDEDAERARYRKKGWSAAKIERALAGRRPKTQPVCELFKDAFAATVRSCGSARILAHNFKGNVDTESIGSPPLTTITLDHYLSRQGRYPADVVHNVTLSSETT